MDSTSCEYDESKEKKRKEKEKENRTGPGWYQYAENILQHLYLEAHSS